eukprot:gnl/MRDRNA2_/MRDRNA2_53488_c0_seq1.p1 gnl/MRDRNA2_/MRDRNA2_53488_c0~~gnl/MRDRNA2_/MRDRNA2_53488_c0_seq1.p1  ORF type:complete len:212 (+),score=38.05 gnl/MRDRNA2_/MRDRNA2_53488_c0_seq1:111-746(+)
MGGGASAQSSNPSKRCGSTREYDARVARLAPEQLVPPEKGEKGETLSNVTIRESESLDSPEICELSHGVIFTLLERGGGRRAKIQTDCGCIGWLSVATRIGQPLVATLDQKNLGAKQPVPHDDFEAGGHQETKCLVTTQESKSLESTEVNDAKEGMFIKSRETENAKVQVSDPQNLTSFSDRIDLSPGPAGGSSLPQTHPTSVNGIVVVVG